MSLIVEARAGETRGEARLEGVGIAPRVFPCALGRAGIVAAKREGDGGTPAGQFPLRRLLYRADRIARIETRLPVLHIEPDDGWCDDPADSAYNRPVGLPYAASHERLWRADHLYDLVLVIGHNDDPVVPGAGSAIFLHLARADWGPTEGCVAFARDDLIAILAALGPTDAIVIGPL